MGGFAGRDEQKAPIPAIARGEHRPGPQEPKVWFSSMESLAQVLSDKNLRLLDVIARARPGSLTELARLSGREKGNLSRTLRTLTNLYNGRPAWLADAHRELDAAVAAAYGWPADLGDEEVLRRLFELNQERAGARARVGEAAE